jgi:hypothetical protein
MPPNFFSPLQMQTSQGEVIITNDGATILKQMSVNHPAAKMVIQFLHLVIPDRIHCSIFSITDG